MDSHLLVELPYPKFDRQAATKGCVALKPSVIAVNAEAHGASQPREFQFSFGLGLRHRDDGFLMPYAGYIRKAIIKTIPPTYSPGNPLVPLTINGVDSLESNNPTGGNRFVYEYAEEGTFINFKTIVSNNNIYTHLNYTTDRVRLDYG